MGGKKKQHHDKRERRESDEDESNPQEKVEEPQHDTKEESFEPIAPKKVSYCPGINKTTQCAAWLLSSANTESRHHNAPPFCIS